MDIGHQFDTCTTYQSIKYQVRDILQTITFIIQHHINTNVIHSMCCYMSRGENAHGANANNNDIHPLKGSPISKALTCMKIYLYKQKWQFPQGD